MSDEVKAWLWTVLVFTVGAGIGWLISQAVQNAGRYS